jgi:hypothetical protein
MAQEVEWLKQRQKAKELEDEEIEREMLERMSRAALRQIEVHLDGWKIKLIWKLNLLTKSTGI